MQDYKKCIHACLAQLSARMNRLKLAYSREVQRRNKVDADNADLVNKLAVMTELATKLTDLTKRDAHGRYKKANAPKA